MSTIYAWQDAAALTALDTSTSDLIFIGDVSAGSATNPVTKVATLYDIGQMALALAPSTLSSNGAAIAGTQSGITTMGTSTAAVLSAATKIGVQRTFASNTSTVAYTVTASASSFGTGTVWTQLGGGVVNFVAVSTARWLISYHSSANSTDLA